MAADKAVHHHSQLVGAKLILLTLLDTILYGNNQFRDVSTFSLHTTSPIRTIIKFLQHQNNNEISFRVKFFHVLSIYVVMVEFLPLSRLIISVGVINSVFLSSRVYFRGLIILIS